MTDVNTEGTIGPEQGHGGRDPAESPQGMSPYSTGGGGVTLERKVAVQYLAHMLVGDGATGIGHGRRVVSVALQEAAAHPADDLVIGAAYPDESKPSLVLAIAVRRSPNLVLSDEPTRKLVRGLVRGLLSEPSNGPKLRWGLVVSGPQGHAEQLAKLADHAATQMDASGFFELIHSPRKFDRGIRGRLGQIEKLVESSLKDLGVAEVGTALVQDRVWQLLGRLVVCMPRLESPDETDWLTVAKTLIPVARGADLTAAFCLRDRLATLASEYSPQSARVDLTMLRRDAHALLDATKRHNEHGWRILDHLHRGALASVRGEIASNDGVRRKKLDRSTAATELMTRTKDAAAVVVSGESGVGKSAFALLTVTDAATADPDNLQVLCINLRHLPKLTVDFETKLGTGLSILLRELSAPGRVLAIDAADAVAEGMESAFRHLVDAARESDMTVVAVTSQDSEQVVRDFLTNCIADGIAEHLVAPLTDGEIGQVVEVFPELSKLHGDPRSCVLLRRLIVIDLLVRGRVSGVPLTAADAMSEVWCGLVRRPTQPSRGTPEARELVLVKLARLELMGGERIDVLSEMDSVALDGLRRDGLLRISPDNPFLIGPEFAHDEVRRYAVARLLLETRDPASSMEAAGAPRWALAAAQLACQALLAEPDTAATPLRGRFAALQGSFSGLVEAGHGARWADVPTDALLTLVDPGAVLKDAWQALVADQAAGLRRIARVVDQRLRDESGIVDIAAVEPIIALLLEDSAPWRCGDYAVRLLRSWLRAHVVAKTPAGSRLRMLLRERLVQACMEADRRPTEGQAAAAAAHTARIPEETEQLGRFEEKHAAALSGIGLPGRRQRRRPKVPHEITDRTVLELLALLGPDLGPHGEEILRRVAKDAPQWLAPAVEEVLTGQALAAYGRSLLPLVTEAYYLDDEPDGLGLFEDGIRRHHSRSFGVTPLAAWYRGPFMSLFQTDFRKGISVLNRLLNHAAAIRARTLAAAHTSASQGRRIQPPEGAIAAYETELEITGRPRVYIGDDSVWLWYRGTGVGPSPCTSGLQALERVCDQVIEVAFPLKRLVTILLDGCENLAMVGLVVGILVRHLERADQLLDPFLVEPMVWHYEFARAASESTGFAAESEGITAPERRKWSLNDVAAIMVVQASGERAATLRALGETLVANARRDVESTLGDEVERKNLDIDDFIEKQIVDVRGWASRLDSNMYRTRQASDGLYIEAVLPNDVAQGLAGRLEKLERAGETSRLTVRYYIEPSQGKPDIVDPDVLANDIVTAQRLIANRSSAVLRDPWDAAALVAAAALKAHVLHDVQLSNDALSFAVDTILRIGEGEVGVRPDEVEAAYFEQGADRSVGRTLPLLLLASAAGFRMVAGQAGGRTTVDRAVRAGLRLARSTVYEVRLHLARGLDHVWESPCVHEGQCHHEIGVRLATETMRDSVFGRWNRHTGRRDIVDLEEPLGESLATAEDKSILPGRLDAAIRAMAPASMADICISGRAHALLPALFSAQRRALLTQEQYHADPRGTHALVTGRALLTLARNGDAEEIYRYIDACADNAVLLGNLLRALAATGEESAEWAAIAQRLWPWIVRHVLGLIDSGHKPFPRGFHGDMALAALLPNPTHEVSYLYRELRGEPITWWKPLLLRREVEEWIPLAQGRATCVDQLIVFVDALSSKEKIHIGLPWITDLVLPDPNGIAAGSVMISTWLIEQRPAAVETDLLAVWQQIVDALVVAGVTRLAPYSD